MDEPAAVRFASRIRTVLRALEDALMPVSCVFCGAPGHRDEPPICSGCASDLPWITASCPRCGSPLASAAPDGMACGRCQVCPPPFDAVVAPLQYRFPVDAAIKAFKFRRRLYYGPAFAAILAAAIRRVPADIDTLLPVPLHWRRQALRGFNQAQELCVPLRRLLDVPILNGVTRIRATPFQSGLGARARQQNLRDAFRVRHRLATRHVLIVDDVVTTGATCECLATVLRQAGARRVSVLAIARAATPE